VGVVPTIAELISGKLVAGLVHPGDDKRPAMTVALPVFRTTGLPEEVVKQVNVTVQMIGEAIVHLIETEGESVIVKRTELEQLQYSAAPNADMKRQATPVHCNCDRNYSDPLMVLTVNGSRRIVVDGKQLLEGLSKRSIECPHRMEP
jgi:hypothetical protein